MTRFANKMMNAVPTLVLRSPMHSLMSARYLLLGFTGRKSRRHYSTPVAYVRDGDRLLISTDSPWRLNVICGRAVTVRLRAHIYTGTGHRVSDPAQCEAAMRALLAIPGYARAAGIERTGGTISAEKIAQAAAQRTVIAIELGSSA